MIEVTVVVTYLFDLICRLKFYFDLKKKVQLVPNRIDVETKWPNKRLKITPFKTSIVTLKRFVR